jgi:two-component system response regulator RegA
MKAGAMDFVEKPADLDALAKKIKKAHHQKAVIVEKQSQDKVIEMLRKYGM